MVEFIVHKVYRIHHLSCHIRSLHDAHAGHTYRDHRTRNEAWVNINYTVNIIVGN